MASDKEATADGEDNGGIGWRTWLLVASVLAATTGLFNVRTVGRLNQPRSVGAPVQERYRKLLAGNDTNNYLNHLRLSADALRKGKIYFPVGDFDCPVTYLVPAGAAVAFAGMAPLVAHNLFFLSIFILNGLAAFAFLRPLLRGTPLALLGAVAYQGSNFVLMCHFMGHMNNVQVLWIPLVFLGASRIVRPGAGWGWAALLGAAFGMQVLSSPYYTLFLAFATLPAFVLAYGVSAWRAGEFGARDWLAVIARLVAAGVLAAIISAFYLLPRMGSPSKTFNTPWYRPHTLDHYLELLDPSDPALFIGFPVFVVGILALRWWYVQPRPITTAVVATGASALAMMITPLPGTPYWIYYHVVPMFNKMRVPLRFFPIFFLMLIALDTMYLDNVSRSFSPKRRRVMLVLVALALLGLNWLASPWIFDFDLAATLKGLLKGSSH